MFHTKKIYGLCGIILELVLSCSLRSSEEKEAKNQGMEGIKNEAFRSFLENYPIISEDVSVMNILETKEGSKEIGTDVISKFLKLESSTTNNMTYYSGYVYFYKSFIAVFTLSEYRYSDNYYKRGLLLHTLDYQGNAKDLAKELVYREVDEMNDDQSYISSYNLEFNSETKEFEISEERLYGSDKGYLEENEKELVDMIISFNENGVIKLNRKTQNE